VKREKPIGGASHSVWYSSHAFRRLLTRTGMASGEMRRPGFWACLVVEFGNVGRSRHLQQAHANRRFKSFKAQVVEYAPCFGASRLSESGSSQRAQASKRMSPVQRGMQRPSDQGLSPITSHTRVRPAACKNGSSSVTKSPKVEKSTCCWPSLRASAGFG
jgi:hypothetical protein